MDFRMRILGDLQKDIDRDILKFETAAMNAANAVAVGAKLDWRNQVTSAGMSKSFSNSVRSKVYPSKKKSFEPAGFVYAEAPKIMRAFDRGEKIDARNKKYLAIPTKFAPTKGVVKGGGGKSGNFRKRISPSTFPEERFGKLEFVPERNGHNAMLVVRGLRKSFSQKTKEFRGYKKAGARFKGKTEKVPMFILVKSVLMPDKFDIPSVGQKWAAKYPEIFDSEVQKMGLVT